ncbi:MAG: hypothetical protein HY730_02595 [Candidatus Tectomicrobia bacterium]|uniref:Dinitrogenase iron-molybdenum cofactor biosynthesis domain-containing protein n=1 Tax=Tectimicrobiota bacterium TaxID=2528274 RepID=A0A933GK05_UNCTE|nr:hypothetical protein [Candidatus Tectomicrobia bacterium]
MIIAIPIFGNRVSPRFDSSQELLIIIVENGKAVSNEKLSMENLDITRRLDQLNSLGVDKIICGGIDSLSLSKLESQGIEVIFDIMGESDLALDLFLKGTLRSGCCCEESRIRCSRMQSRSFLRKRNNRDDPGKR